MGNKLFVGNLAYSATENDLRDFFADAGDVSSVKVIMDRDTGRPRGFAFVEMASDAEASKAISLLNGRDLQGRAVTVREAEDRGPRQGGSDPGRERGGRGGGGRGGGGGRNRW